MRGSQKKIFVGARNVDISQGKFAAEEELLNLIGEESNDVSGYASSQVGGRASQATLRGRVGI